MFSEGPPTHVPALCKLPHTATSLVLGNQPLDLFRSKSALHLPLVEVLFLNRPEAGQAALRQPSEQRRPMVPASSP